MKIRIRLGWSRIVLGIYMLLLVVSYILMRNGAVGEIYTGIVFSWQLLILFLGLARLTTKPLALGLILTFIGAFTMLPLFTDIFPGLSGLVSNQSFWIIVPIFVAIVIAVSEIIRYSRRRAERKSRPAVQSGLSEDGMLYERVSFSSRSYVVDGGFLAGGTLSVSSASVEIDLSRCSIPEGISVIDLDTIMGSVRLKIPHDWYVELKTTNILGTARDIRRPDEGRDVSRTLLIKGTVSLGALVVTEPD